ncbi:hypothetical protein KLEP7_gp186 [Pseudaeromonas phage vB_PpeM_ KLEP7]|nr:hypothetical protein KLEP7_gp186 [Pseudaeromonas phage vB_PpeM_ KLEP7]
MEEYKDYFENLMKDHSLMEVISHAMCLSVNDSFIASLAQDYIGARLYDCELIDPVKFYNNINLILTFNTVNKAPLFDENGKPHSFWFEAGLALK